MKYKLKYSPDASDKLRELNRQMKENYGKTVATRVATKIMGEIRSLQELPEKGASMEAILGLPTPYRFLHVEQNYIFYRIEKDTVYVADIYNERENFLWRLFGVNLRTKDSMDIWGE